MVERIHKDKDAFSTVGVFQLMKEPLQNTENGDTNWLVEHFYPSDIDRIRAKENALDVPGSDALHITVMVCFLSMTSKPVLRPAY
jgi:hypothetical protein